MHSLQGLDFLVLHRYLRLANPDAGLVWATLAFSLLSNMGHSIPVVGLEGSSNKGLALGKVARLRAF